jgi:hypothetical protein
MLDPEDEDTAVFQNVGNYALIDKYQNTWFFTGAAVCALTFTARKNVTISAPQCMGRRSDVALNSVPYARHLSPSANQKLFRLKKLWTFFSTSHNQLMFCDWTIFKRLWLYNTSSLLHSVHYYACILQSNSREHYI